MQLEKFAPGLATPDLVMSLAEVERRGSTSIDSSHDLLVGNDDVGSTLEHLDMHGDRARHVAAGA